MSRKKFLSLALLVLVSAFDIGVSWQMHKYEEVQVKPSDWTSAILSKTSAR